MRNILKVQITKQEDNNAENPVLITKHKVFKNVKCPLGCERCFQTGKIHDNPMVGSCFISKSNGDIKTLYFCKPQTFAQFAPENLDGAAKSAIVNFAGETALQEILKTLVRNSKTK